MTTFIGKQMRRTDLPMWKVDELDVFALTTLNKYEIGQVIYETEKAVYIKFGDEKDWVNLWLPKSVFKEASEVVEPNRYELNMAENERLYNECIEKGIKGVRKGMKSNTYRGLLAIANRPEDTIAEVTEAKKLNKKECKKYVESFGCNVNNKMSKDDLICVLREVLS